MADATPQRDPAATQASGSGRRRSSPPPGSPAPPPEPSPDSLRLAPLEPEVTAASGRPLSGGGGLPIPLPPPAGAAGLPARRIGQYTLTRKLGQGGMGAVYEAVDGVLRRRVAMKVLPAGVAESDASVKRFLREARSAAALNHPNAVTVYEVARKGGVIFIAMELVPGGSAQDLLAKRGRLPPSEATRVLADACRALAAAHVQGLVHRDIKPANLLLAADGSTKVTDFGLAKAVAGEQTVLTTENALLGTPLYMSPEQCRGEAVDARADVYALGCTYYALLTGRAPYDRPTVVQLLYAHCHEPSPDPRDVSADTPEACIRILRRAMAKMPGERYATAMEMLADLEAFLRGDTPVAETFGALYELETTAAASPTSPSALSADPLPSLAGVPALRPRRRGASPMLLAAAAGCILGGGVLAAVVVTLRPTARPSEPAPVATSGGQLAASTPAAAARPPIAAGAGERAPAGVPPDNARNGGFPDGREANPPPPVESDPSLVNDPVIKEWRSLQETAERAAASGRRDELRAITAKLAAFYQEHRGETVRARAEAARRALRLADEYEPGTGRRLAPLDEGGGLGPQEPGRPGGPGEHDQGRVPRGPDEGEGPRGHGGPRGGPRDRDDGPPRERGGPRDGPTRGGGPGGGGPWGTSPPPPPSRGSR